MGTPCSRRRGYHRISWTPHLLLLQTGSFFALDGGNASSHATLYALDAATGKQLYTSADAIGSYTHLAGYVGR